MSKPVPSGKAWLPTVVLGAKAKDLEVCLNPYTTQKQGLLPAALTESSAPLRRALLSRELESLLIALDTRTEDTNGKKLTQEDLQVASSLPGSKWAPRIFEEEKKLEAVEEEMKEEKKEGPGLNFNISIVSDPAEEDKEVQGSLPKHDYYPLVLTH